MVKAKHYLTATSEYDEGRFTCDGGPDASCHLYPDCECEYWDDEHEAGEGAHKPVVHDSCWKTEWLNTGSSSDNSLDELMPSEIHDGEIIPDWQGDWMGWTYASNTNQTTEGA